MKMPSEHRGFPERPSYSGAASRTPNPSEPSSTLLTPHFLLGFFYNFLLSLHFTSNAIYPLYVLHEGGTVATVGLYMGVYSVAGVLGRPFVGLLIDRFGSKPVLILGSLCLSLPALMYIFFLGHGLGIPVWTLRVVQGFGYGAHFSATFTLAAQLSPRARRTEAMALYGVSGLSGSMVGPLFSEYLVTQHGLAWFFAAMTGFGILAATVISRLTPPRREESAGGRMADIVPALRGSGLKFVGIAAFLLAISYTCPMTFLATFARAHSIEKFSLYFTAWGLAGILVRTIGGKWGDRYGSTRMLVPGMALYGCGLVLIVLSTSLPTIVLAGLFCGAAHGVSFPAVASLAFTLAPKAFRGVAMSLVTGMMDVGTATIAFAGGPLAEQFGVSLVFPVAAIASFAGAGLATAKYFREKAHATPDAGTAEPSSVSAVDRIR